MVTRSRSAAGEQPVVLEHSGDTFAAADATDDSRVSVRFAGAGTAIVENLTVGQWRAMQSATAGATGFGEYLWTEEGAPAQLFSIFPPEGRVNEWMRNSPDFP